VELSENSLKVAKSRYIRSDLGIETTWKETCQRVSMAVASVDSTSNTEYWAERFFDMLYSQKALGGGRILRNAGTPLNKILNCHVLPLNDSIGEIGEFLNKALVLNAEGGGIGCSPNLRPKGATVKGKGGKSSGLLSFLRIISYSLSIIESGGNRRSGVLPIVDASHPEIIDFINSKLKHDELNNFNISVGITNEFLDAVEQKKKWTLRFEDQEYDTIWANDLFDMIIENNLKSGEPGIVNIDNMKISNSWYFSPVTALNLCAELKLSDNQSCCIGSIIISNFLKGSSTDWIGLGSTIKTLVRFLDNALDLNDYSFPEMKEATLSCRRIGVGMIGLGEFLLKKHIRYGSDESLSKISNLIGFMRNKIYEASIELAQERGPFPGFNKWAYLNAKFVKKLPAKIRMQIKEHSIRNCTGMAFAPGGTISLIADTTSGIEPLPLKAYKRKDKVGERVYVHPEYKKVVEKGTKTPDWLVDSLDLAPEDHFEVAATIQSLNDGSLSKTEILPASTSHSQLKDWILEYSRKLVGITTYVDGSRADQILNKLTKKEIKDYLKSDEKIESTLDEKDVECARGTCDI